MGSISIHYNLALKLYNNIYRSSIPSSLHGNPATTILNPSTEDVSNNTSAQPWAASPSLVISNISSHIPIKLNLTNYLLWKSLFEPILRGHKLMHLLDGTTLVPVNVDSPWYKKDQMLLSWINATLSESALLYIVGVSSAKKAWDLLKHQYASTTPAHIMSLKRQLSCIKKGSQSMSTYLQQFKTSSDQLATYGSPISDDNIVLFILDSLPSSYRQFSSSVRIRACSTVFTIEKLHNLLLCEETAIANETLADTTTTLAAFQFPSTIYGHENSTHRGRHNNRGFNYQRSIFHDNTFAKGILPSLNTSTYHNAITCTQPQCQICQKPSHLAIDCYHHMDHAYQGHHPPEKLATMVSSLMPAMNTWYSDTGASHHLTPDIENLQISSPYEGNDTVQIGNGQGLPISNIGSATIPYSPSPLKFRKILHYHTAVVYLLSIHQFSIDNNCEFIFDKFNCCVKDKTNEAILYHGPVKHGFYLFRFSASPPSASPQAHVSTTIPSPW
ncbi:hypothetical protein NE237_005809 [Protea cynaroides]|uniref:Retrotransposon Copia-like N-terminal domain-containing protein n=1 Tax=Protea cynaroides TaxID=273540 RepID=A0A9Q0KLG3_9MAGN|nr:hypothetical protein NE237_005809 [Protea cynaroides]